MSDYQYPTEYPTIEADPIIKALDEWYRATEPWMIPKEAEEITDEEVLLLYHTMLVLRQRLSVFTSAIGQPMVNRELHPLFSDANQVIGHLIALTGSYLGQHYSDSDMDASSDVEWDVNQLLEKADIGFITPMDVRPAYVSNYFDGPPEDSE